MRCPLGLAGEYIIVHDKKNCNFTHRMNLLAAIFVLLALVRPTQSMHSRSCRTVFLDLPPSCPTILHCSSQPLSPAKLQLPVFVPSQVTAPSPRPQPSYSSKPSSPAQLQLPALLFSQATASSHRPQPSSSSQPLSPAKL